MYVCNIFYSDFLLRRLTLQATISYFATSNVKPTSIAYSTLPQLAWPHFWSRVRHSQQNVDFCSKVLLYTCQYQPQLVFFWRPCFQRSFFREFLRTDKHKRSALEKMTSCLLLYKVNQWTRRLKVFRLWHEKLQGEWKKIWKI